MKKRILSLFLVVCMLVGMLPGFALPVSAVGGDDISVRFTDTVGNVLSRDGDSFFDAFDDSGVAAGDVKFIEVTGGKITAADWEYITASNRNFSELTSLTVAEAVYPVADIPDNFFDFNGVSNKLQSVSIPNATAIGDYAFFICHDMTEVSIPDAVTIGQSAFDRCSALAEIILPDATIINDNAFWHCSELVNVEIPKVTTIGASAFSGCSSLADIELPEGTSVGDEAFSYCTALTEVSIPNLSSVGRNMFYACTNLIDADLPNITAIGDYAFYGCANLIDADLPNVTVIGDYAFYGCNKFNAVSIPSVESIGIQTFHSCRSLTTLKVPETPPAVTDASSFENCPSCRNLVFVDVNGDELTNEDLNNARAAYKAVDDGDTTDNLWYGWNIIPKIELSIDRGSIDISDGSVYGSKITQGSRIYDNYASDNMITITGTSSTNNIVVNGVTAKVTLREINIDVSGTDDSCALQLTGGANVQLMLSGENYLTSHTKRAGLEVPLGQTIYIDGGETDSLTATSRSEYSGGAGIGGTGLGLGVDCGTINISGGNITANGGDWSSGIGGGKAGQGGIINISGGRITATGGGSGIGGGAYAVGGTINITGGDITAIGGSSGIGGGYNNGNENNPACDAAVTIMEEATVKASSEYTGEAISANNGILEASSTARILAANFAEEQDSGNTLEVYRAVYGDYLTGITLSEAYLSTAFTVPAGTCNLKNSGKMQQYTNTDIPTAIDFVIPDTAGIYIFDQVEDAPVLTSVSISGTAQVGKTLTALVSPSGASAALQWKADAADIDGATGNTYVPVAADIGKAITVTATATGEWFGTVTSDHTSEVIAASAAPSRDKGGKSKAMAHAVIKSPEKPGLPYYIKDGKKIFIGFSATGKYIVPEGATVQFGENPKSFTDIENHWARSSIEFVAEREIFLGIDDNRFGPELSMTRAMFVTVIGRLYERSYGSIIGNTTFSDVDKEAYYAGYVAWAHENGIIEGIGGSSFAPEAEVSREQMAAIMFRFASFLGKAPQVSGTAGISYPDKADISGWAMDSAQYCQLTNIITGVKDGRFEPKAAATRAEVAAVIERFINEILKAESLQ